MSAGGTLVKAKILQRATGWKTGKYYSIVCSKQVLEIFYETLDERPFCAFRSVCMYVCAIGVIVV